jgi:hypothetical protein
MPRGFFKPGNKYGIKGRPKGAKNKRTRFIEAHALAIETQLANGMLTPLEFMLTVMRNSEIDTNIRLAAAQGAAPYVHPRAPAAHRTLKHSFDPGISFAISQERNGACLGAPAISSVCSRRILASGAPAGLFEGVLSGRSPLPAACPNRTIAS